MHFRESSEIDQSLHTTRSIQKLIGQKLSERFARIPGIKATRPTDGFYFLTDSNELKINMLKKEYKIKRKDEDYDRKHSKSETGRIM